VAAQEGLDPPAEKSDEAQRDAEELPYPPEEFALENLYAK